MKIKYLVVILLIFVNLLAIELLLEVRAKTRGFSAFLLDASASINEVEPSQEQKFKYRSEELAVDKPENSVRIWMSSASYAEDSKRKIDELFPNILCQLVNTRLSDKCQMINASIAGFSIRDNINQLKSEAIHWKPDYVMLYTMNIDINELSKKYLKANSDPTDNIEGQNPDDSRSGSLSIGQMIEKTIEQTTIYGHLRTYIGGATLLSTLLHSDIGFMAKKDFEDNIRNYIQTTREIGATPILTTFSTKYGKNGSREMSFEDKLWLVRYNEYLSDDGWLNTIHSFNEIIRRIASEENVYYIDLEKSVTGKEEYFSDFVHFTKSGHEAMGELLASDFLKILINTSENRNDI